VDATWVEGIFDADSEQLVRPVRTRPAGGMVWRDGTLALLDVRGGDGEVELHRRLPDGRAAVLRAPVAASVSAGPRMVWDQIVWTAAAGRGRHELFAQTARPDAEMVGPIESLGTTAAIEGMPEFDLCRTERTLVLLVTGQRRDESLGPTGRGVPHGTYTSARGATDSPAPDGTRPSAGSVASTKCSSRLGTCPSRTGRLQRRDRCAGPTRSTD
jgi:hypothetical protein